MREFNRMKVTRKIIAYNPLFDKAAFFLDFGRIICYGSAGQRMMKTVGPSLHLRFPDAMKWGGIAIFLFSVFLGDDGLFTLVAASAVIALLDFLFDFRGDNAFTPYLLMFFSPPLLLRYSSIPDFRIRLVTFLFFVYMVTFAVSPKPMRFRISLERIRPAYVWLLAFTVFSLAAAVMTWRGVYLSGDEPHYVLMAQSLVEDGDIDLKNNLEGKTYLNYNPVDLDFHGGVYRGRYLPFHMPGLPMLLVPFYWLFSVIRFSVPPQLYFRLVAALINSFFALGLFQLLQALFPQKKITVFWLFSISTFPLVFHSLHLYPEIPAATLLLCAFLWGVVRRRFLPLVAFSLALIPWFHVKYSLPVLLLAFFIAGSRVQEKKFIQAFFFVLTVAGGFVLLLIYSKVLYGSFNPNSIFPPADYFSVTWRIRLETLFAFFLDQRDGVLVYAPLSLFLFFGLRKGTRYSFLLPSVFFAYLFFHAFTTIRGAYSPAGRPLMFVYWIGVVFIAHYYFDREDVPGFWFRFAAGFTLFSTFWLAIHPLFLYQPVTATTTEGASSWLLFLGSDFVPLPELFPSFLKTSRTLNPANTAWIAIWGVAILLFYLRRKVTVPFRARAALAFLLFAVLTFALCFYPHIHLRNDQKFISREIRFFNSSRNLVFHRETGTFRMKAGSHYDIFVEAFRPEGERVILHFLNTDQAGVELRNGRNILFRSLGAGEESVALNLSGLRKLKVGKNLLVPISIDPAARRPGSFLFLRFE